ncbi:hypothetical protein Syun_015518 [Stephania yunnanensis]|uniref:Uncharacterized protein n=1 Tax=Stephania yunnanensis TaxID=152371 RepID=A0AAP0JN14_9MAGN
MLQQPREAGEVADFGPAGGGYAEATAVQQQVAGGIVSSWTAAAAACQRLQPRGSRRVTRTRATRLQRRRSAAERMVRLVRTAAATAAAALAVAVARQRRRRGCDEMNDAVARCRLIGGVTSTSSATQ